METVIVTGGTGLIGKAIVSELILKGYKVFVFTRDRIKNKKTENGCIYSYWNIKTKEVDEELLFKADYIIHLAGAGVADKRWSARRKQELSDSRVESGHLLTECLLKRPGPLKAFINASAIGWYGPDPALPGSFSPPFTEEHPHANDFLGNLCYQWEESTRQLAVAGVRTAYLRTGIVLSNKGGALPAFGKPLKMRLAAISGNGEQVISWIHIDDLVNLYITMMEQEPYNGVYNAVAPEPVSNEALMLALAKTVQGTAFIKVHIPQWILKLLLGEMSSEVLKSTTVSAQKLMDTGFKFRFPGIEPALQHLIKK